MGNGAAAGVMAADFLVVMNRVLFPEMLVNLSHHEHPACSAGNPNSLSVSVILLFQTFLHPPTPPAPLPRQASAADGSSDCCSPTPNLCRCSVVFFFFYYSFPDVPPLVWRVSGAGGRSTTAATALNIDIFLLRQVLFWFFFSLFSVKMVAWTNTKYAWSYEKQFHHYTKENNKRKQNKLSEKTKIQQLKTTISA